MDNEAVDKLSNVVVQLDVTAENLTIAYDRLIDQLARSMQQSSSSSGNITIQAGGITNAVAVCVSLTAIVLFVVFAVWISVQKANMESEQRAWVAVMQQQIVEAKKAKE